MTSSSIPSSSSYRAPLTDLNSTSRKRPERPTSELVQSESCHRPFRGSSISSSSTAPITYSPPRPEETSASRKRPERPASKLVQSESFHRPFQGRTIIALGETAKPTTPEKIPAILQALNAPHNEHSENLREGLFSAQMMRSYRKIYSPIILNKEEPHARRLSLLKCFTELDAVQKNNLEMAKRGLKEIFLVPQDPEPKGTPAEPVDFQADTHN